MTEIVVVLHPVSFALESARPQFMSLRERDGSVLERPVSSTPDETAQALLEELLTSLVETLPNHTPEASVAELRRLATRYLALVGVETDGKRVALLYTSSIPTPFAEEATDLTAGSPFSWWVVNESRATHPGHDRPAIRHGAEGLLLDHWRQTLEETDIALDFLPEHLNLLQLRRLYDAVWGYDQDPSGFKRWAIDRTGAFRDLLDEIPMSEVTTADTSFFDSLGDQLTPSLAAKAGASVAGGLDGDLAPELRLPIAVAAATTINRLHPRRGPEPTWYRKAASWRQGPTWIENVYPPRPNWTRWDVVARAADRA